MNRKILVVDDNFLVRRGIVQVLSGELADTIVAEVSTEMEALAAIWSQDCSLVFLEASLPGRGGVVLLKEIRAARPRLPVIAMSSHPESQIARRLLRAGASGYLTKDVPLETFVSATRQVLAGGKYISSALAAQLATDFGGVASKLPHELLSDREYEVMLRIAAGQSLGNIADALTLSVKTVSTYRTRILEKMYLLTNADLTRYAFRNKLLE